MDALGRRGVAQLVVANDESSLGGQLVGGADLVALASLAYPAPQGAPVPVALRFHFRKGASARAAADDLGRQFARARAVREVHAERFPVTSAIALEGDAVVVRGTMPFETIARWCG